jgi:hypothetical protein
VGGDGGPKEGADMGELAAPVIEGEDTDDTGDSVEVLGNGTAELPTEVL